MRTKMFLAACLLLPLSALALPPPATQDLPLDIAVAAAQAAISACRSNGYKVSIVVLDADYGMRVALRDADAEAVTIEIGRRKAYTVIKTGVSSREFGNTVPNQPPPPAPGAGPPPIPGAINGDPSLIPWAGGLPIRVGGKLLGAMSASGAPGGDKDEACVAAGLAVIAARLK
jgi:uncharacterized protein GlcG (DUF336 family)